MIKGIEWLKEEIEKIDVETSENFPHYEVISKNIVLYLINQLGRRNLSQKRIDDNIFEVDSWNKVVNVNLQNLLVPKQEEPEKVVVPAFVGEYITLAKADINLYKVAFYATTNNELPKWEKEYNWIRTNFETFMRAWLAYPNIEVEKEQKYILSINITDKASKTNYETFLNKRGIFNSMENKSFNSEEFNWSEEEIKGLESGEILFEHFATKVEELEE